MTDHGASSDGVVIEPEPGGPLVVRGRVRLTDADGQEIATTSAIRLCRCGRTGDAPFCDDTHLQGRPQTRD